MESAAEPTLAAECGLYARPFVVASIHPGSLVEPNSTPPVRNNETVGLVAWGGADADGN